MNNDMEHKIFLFVSLKKIIIYISNLKKEDLYKKEILISDPSIFENLHTLNDFLDKNSDRKVNLTEILEKWSNPPYGIKLGLVPILAVTFYLARNDKIALFVDEIFTPDFDEYAINRLYENSNLLVNLRLGSLRG